MTIDELRRAVVEALGGKAADVNGEAATARPDVRCGWPKEAARASGAPFAVVELKSVELKSLGFGEATARRGVFAFAVNVYARDGGELAEALAALAVRAGSDAVRALLGGAKFSAGEPKAARDGLIVGEATLAGEAFVRLTPEGEAEVISFGYIPKVVEI